MIECFLITKTDGSILYSAHYGGNQSLTTVQETEATIYRLTNQNWNHAKGGNFDVAYAEYVHHLLSVFRRVTHYKRQKSAQKVAQLTIRLFYRDRLIVFTNVDDLLFFAVKSTKNSYEDDELSCTWENNKKKHFVGADLVL